MNRLDVRGDWSTVSGKLKERWAVLTDDDLQYSDGKQEQLVGRIQQCTGEPREVIVSALKEACSPYS